MKKNFVYIFIFILLPLLSVKAQLEKVIVETYYISDAFDSTDVEGGKLELGSTTYRIFLLLKPNSRLIQLYGDANHPIKFESTKTFYNNIDGQTYAKDIKKVKYNQNTVGVDTYLTLGQTAATLAGKTNFGVPKRLDRDGSFIGGVNNDGGSAAIAAGLLSNANSKAGIPLTKADGMDTMNTLPKTWTSFGVKDFLSGNDSTIFGSLALRKSYVSRNMFLKNSGVRGVNADSNYVLVAQLTTKGELSFELNVEIEELLKGDTIRVKYVANDSTLLSGEKKSRYLKYPFEAPVCGCKDDSYIEYNANFECADNINFCKTKIVFGCSDSLACNFDPNVTVPLSSMCCYIGYCNGRNIAYACPKINGHNFSVQLAPNPIVDDLSLTVNGGTTNDIRVQVLDYTGSVIVQQVFEDRMQLLNQNIALSAYPSGIYFIVVTYNGLTDRKMFIKQ